MGKKIAWIVGVLVLVLVSCGVGTAIGLGGSGTSSSTPKASATVTATVTATARPAQQSSSAAPKPKPKPTGMTVGNWKVVGGKIIPKNDGMGDFTTIFRVQNTGSSTDQGIFTVNVLKGNNIWASLDCTTGNIAAGAIGTASCLFDGHYRTGWSAVTIENSF